MEFQVRLEPETQDLTAGFFLGRDFSFLRWAWNVSTVVQLKKAKTTQRLFTSTTSHGIGQE